MGKAEKTIIYIITIVLNMLLLCSCEIKPFFHTAEETEQFHLNEFRLSQQLSKYIFGVDPETFYKTKGQGTALDNGYTNVIIRDDEFVLQLTDEQVENWKNASEQLQILQKIVGEERNVVSKIILPTTFPYDVLYEGAASSDLIVADDYSKIAASPQSDSIYNAVVPYACILMQVLEGVPSEDIQVEYVVYDADNRISQRMVFPISIYIFRDLDECEELKFFEQAFTDIQEYETPIWDEAITGIHYSDFWGMKYVSDQVEFEIFAYEFADEANARAYYDNATNDHDIEVSDGCKKVSGDQYHVVALDGNKAYTLVTSSYYMEIIDTMLASMFSVKITN